MHIVALFTPDHGQSISWSYLSSDEIWLPGDAGAGVPLRLTGVVGVVLPAGVSAVVTLHKAPAQKTVARASGDTKLSSQVDKLQC